MNADLMQRQRFELKFRVNEHVAQAVIAAVSRRLEPDPFGLDQPDHAYDIHSLYLDSPDLALYHSTLNGDRNRFKLRLRYYNDDPASPVFLETKRRVNECILKERVAVHRDRLIPLLLQTWPTPSDLVRDDAEQLTLARNFCRRLDRIQARPVAHVAYRREAWFAPGHNGVRVTVDRHIRCEPRGSYAISTALEQPTSVFSPGQIILEIKFTERFPNWLSDLARELSLVRSSAAKYVDGLTRSGTHRYDPAQLLYA